MARVWELRVKRVGATPFGRFTARFVPVPTLVNSLDLSVIRPCQTSGFTVRGSLCVGSDLASVGQLSELVSGSSDLIADDMTATKIFEMRGCWFNVPQRRYIAPLATFLADWVCLDPRDRMYAMLAFMRPEISISADYNRSAAQLSIEIFQSMLGSI